MAFYHAYGAKPLCKEHRPLSLSQVPFQSLKIPQNTSSSLIEHLLWPSLCSVAHLGQGGRFMVLMNFSTQIWDNVLGIRSKTCFNSSGRTTIPSISPEYFSPCYSSPTELVPLRPALLSNILLLRSSIKWVCVLFSSKHSSIGLFFFCCCPFVCLTFILYPFYIFILFFAYLAGYSSAHLYSNSLFFF